MRELSDHIFLIGFMGTGKSTVAKRLAEFYQVPRRDVDEEIVRKSKMPIVDIFQTQGEAHFRMVEREVLKELSKDGMPYGIISCGGGLALDDRNQKWMKERGTVILLLASPSTIYRRLKDDKSRPLLKDHMDQNYIEQLMKEREGRYHQAADLIIHTDHKNVKDLIDEIQTAIKERQGEQNVKEVLP